MEKHWDPTIARMDPLHGSWPRYDKIGDNKNAFYSPGSRTTYHFVQKTINKVLMIIHFSIQQEIGPILNVFSAY